MSQVYAHRGLHTSEIENTVAAFVEAKAVGVHGVELDVRRTKDGALVVHHDATISGVGARIAIVCNITPAAAQSEETSNTLKFAMRAKLVKGNEVVCAFDLTCRACSACVPLLSAPCSSLTSTLSPPTAPTLSRACTLSHCASPLALPPHSITQVRVVVSANEAVDTTVLLKRYRCAWPPCARSCQSCASHSLGRCRTTSDIAACGCRAISRRGRGRNGADVSERARGRDLSV